MEDIEKTRGKLIIKTYYIKDLCPNVILPDDLESLPTAGIKTLEDYHITKINKKNEIYQLKESYLKIMYILQCLYLTLIKDRSKYEELDMLRPKGVKLRLNKSELHDKILVLFRNFKTDLIACKNISLLEDEHLIRFIDVILQLDDIHNINQVLKIIERCDVDDAFTFH